LNSIAAPGQLKRYMLSTSHQFLNSTKALVAVVAFCAGAFAQAAQRPADVVARQVPQPFVEREDTIQNSFMWALVQTKTPGGLIFSSDVDQNTRFKLSPTTLALRDVLDALVLSDPRYKWNVSNGVINLSGVADHPALLDTQVAAFTMEKATAHEMIDSILDLPEVRRASTSLGFGNTGAREYDGPVGLTVATVDCRSCSLRDLLNEIVRTNGRAVWYYREYDSGGKKYFQLGLLFES
jgi:hypothetical protein